MMNLELKGMTGVWLRRIGVESPDAEGEGGAHNRSEGLKRKAGVFTPARMNLSGWPVVLILLLFAFGCNNKPDKTYRRFEVKPSMTDKTIRNADVPHLVMYDTLGKQGKLMVYLNGTGGISVSGPEDYYETVVERGYRLISLSYINEPSAAEVCNGVNGEWDCDCADEFHLKRVYGLGVFNKIRDEPQDAIINRLVKLIEYLEVNDRGGNWGYYLNYGKLRWSEIAFSGHSQGGGMAEFIAKHDKVYKVISFSGGWDVGSNGRVATWYATPNETPADAWYGTYNMREPTGDLLLMQYEAIGIPKKHIYALDLPVAKEKAHTDGIKNIRYKWLWEKMLGKGN